MQAVKEAKVQDFAILFLMLSWLHQGNHLCLLIFQRAHWKLDDDRLVVVLISKTKCTKEHHQANDMPLQEVILCPDPSFEVNILSSREACMCIANEYDQNPRNEQATSISDNSSDRECKQ